MEGYTTVTVRLLLALVAGGIIGFERSYRGRNAGFRTHVLVCTASCLLILMMAQQWQLVAAHPQSSVRLDPTRMAAGIMTGIGFLGAGVIMKEHFTIRGLTTAASIWVTSAIGIVIGAGYYYAAGLVTVLALGTLAGFRWVEAAMPAYAYGRLRIRLSGDHRFTGTMLTDLLHTHDIYGGDTSYRAEVGAGRFEYQLSIHTRNETNFARLADTLRHTNDVEEFSIEPAGT